MRRAIDLAVAGWGRVHPNPLVGAVVVRDGVVVGEGAHREYGGPHAEVEALRAAGDRARSATLYVTLEPCAHHGRTPPCTDAVLAAGVRRVVYAVADPDPRAAGGAAVLRAAGLEMRAGVEEDAARRQNALFLGPLERDRPFIALKYGLSLDARIARAAGERTRITGPEAEAEVHRLRAGFDAILVGGGTVRTDDPLLTARGSIPPRVPPVRVVVSSTADISLDGRLLASIGEAPVWVVATGSAPAERVSALERRGARVLRIDGGGSPEPADGDSLDLTAAVRHLGEAGIRTILCEGGGRIGSALVAARLVDRLYLFHAPVLYGAKAVPAFVGRDLRFEGRVGEVRRFGRDVLMTVERSD